MKYDKPCPTCDGTGEVYDGKVHECCGLEHFESCPDCGGTGRIEDEYDTHRMSHYNGKTDKDDA